MDRIAFEGKSGLLKTVPNDMSPDSAVANLSIMGYDPMKYFTGRGPFEASVLGIDLKDTDVAFRCNLITFSDPQCGHFTLYHFLPPTSLGQPPKSMGLGCLNQ